jgi:hypothetical protein
MMYYLYKRAINHGSHAHLALQSPAVLVLPSFLRESKAKGQGPRGEEEARRLRRIVCYESPLGEVIYQ